MLRSPRVPLLGLHCLFVFALAALLVPPSAYAADQGDECKVGFGVAPSYLCTNNTVCLKAISKMYCSNPTKQCGWNNTSGYNLGQKKTYRGNSYECTATGFKRAKAGRGQECKVGPSVARQYLCETGYFCVQSIDKMYCSNAGKPCGWPGTGGYSLGQTKTQGNTTYECTATGFQPETSGTTIGGGVVTTVPNTGPKTRRLNSSEQRIARQVFGRSLNLGQVRITNTLGAQSRPWTTNSPPVYTVNVGPVAYKNLATSTWSDLLIHELTHVWQGQHGVPFMANSAVHQTISAIQNGGDTGQAYDYSPGKQWRKYNSEQQASLVEDWFENGASRSDRLYPYIRDNVLPGKPKANTNFK